MRRGLGVAVVVLTAMLALCGSAAEAERERPPVVAPIDRGASIDGVTVETYGTITPEVALRYLSLKKGDSLQQLGVDRDYANLTKLAGLRVRLQLRRRPGALGIMLHWIVLGKQFEVTDHPFYGDQPLTIPIEGFGFVVSSPRLDRSGATISSYSQIALRAQLARIVYTKPLWVDSGKGREGDFILNTLGARGDYRASEPVTEDVYSWLSGDEALYLVRGTNGTQVEFGFRVSRSTSVKPTYLTAPSLYDTYYAPARNTTFEAGLSHICPVAPTQWYPPYCRLQYRLETFDSIGGLGATSNYRLLFADAAQYTRIGSSTLALHGGLNRTGGTIPTSILLCAYTFGYAKATCGTDTNILQAEFRIADARPGSFKFVFFTETASSRVRGSDQSIAPASYQWRADSGVGAIYRGIRFNLAYGSQGGRITYEVQGQLF